MQKLLASLLTAERTALNFLTQLSSNASLLANAEAYSLLPRDIESILERATL